MLETVLVTGTPHYQMLAIPHIAELHCSTPAMYTLVRVIQLACCQTCIEEKNLCQIRPESLVDKLLKQWSGLHHNRIQTLARLGCFDDPIS